MKNTENKYDLAKNIANSSFSPYKEDRSLLPEEALWSAVLQQAFMDLVKNKTTCVSTVENAKDWFASEEDSIGSLKWICETIDLKMPKVLQYVSSMLYDRASDSTP